MSSFIIIWSLTAGPILLALPIFALLMVAELFIQFSEKKPLYRLNDAIANFSCGITQQVANLFLKVLGVGCYQFIYENFAFFYIPVTWYTIIVLFVLADFLYYWAHRKSHEINLLWAAHAIHHQSEDFNLSVALRQGALQTLWNALFYLPLAFFGFDTLSFVSVSVFVNLYQFWLHTETIGKLGWLENIVNTPSHHRVHHGRDPKYIDKNHAGVLILWDKLFGTFQKEEEHPVYGTTEPVNSWNPLWINIKPFVDMSQLVKQTPKKTHKLGIIFNKPGWLPEHLGGYQAAQEVDKHTYVKYNATGSRAIHFYISFQFLFVLAGTSLLLLYESNMLLYEKIVSILLLLAALVSLSALFEVRTRAILFEFGRIVFTFMVMLFFSRLHTAVILFGSAYFLFSWLWLLVIRFKKRLPRWVAPPLVKTIPYHNETIS